MRRVVVPAFHLVSFEFHLLYKLPETMGNSSRVLEGIYKKRDDSRCHDFWGWQMDGKPIPDQENQDGRIDFMVINLGSGASIGHNGCYRTWKRLLVLLMLDDPSRIRRCVEVNLSVL
jgi:hypothetical protein